MHVSVGPFDFGWALQYVLTAFFIVLGLLYLVRNTASKCFQVDANFESQSDRAAVATDQSAQPPRGSQGESACARCGTHARRRCSACKSVWYCSSACQRAHWGSDHSKKCRQLQLVIRRSETDNHESKSFDGHSKSSLVTANGSTKISELSKKILFPYDEFVELFNSSKPEFLPCGLLNCGNSCFANVVLQCLTFTRPLVSYLLEKGHRKDCKRNDWCFLCELQSHVERASRSPHPFSPLCILSRLPNIGSNFDYGKQEDAHEFMRFAIDTMQSVCLDEFGGEKALHLSAQETSLIQHIFGGHLQSQVICSECNMVSNQYENMMDLTVEIQGDAESLEDCLDQFTVREWLHGENMYKCDGCNGYVKASKCLTVHRAPNILTIALKRFQSGRFGKLNKRVSFPEILDLTPYMSEPGDGSDVYKLYAVVVHMDMLNASFFGHYVCYIKDFRGNWCRVDDDKVRTADLEEVFSQGAYMLLYSRVRARSCCLSMIVPPKKVEDETVKIAQEEDGAATDDLLISMESPPHSNGNLCSMLPNQEEEGNSEDVCVSIDAKGGGNSEDVGVSIDAKEEEGNSEDVSVSIDAEACGNGSHEANGSAVPCSPNDDMEVIMEVLPEVLKSTGISIFENGDRSCLIPVSDNGSSTSSMRRMKAEPLFSPGFLNKRPRRDVAKRGDGGVGSGCNGFCPLQEALNGSVKLCNGSGERSAGLK